MSAPELPDNAGKVVPLKPATATIEPATTVKPTKAKAGANGNGHAKIRAIPLGAPLWYPGLILGREGPRDCVANVCMVLRLDAAFAGRIAYNELRERVVVKSLPWRKTKGWRDWEDRDSVGLAEWCQLRDLVIKPSTAAPAAVHVAHEHRFNPLRDRLDGLAWDGVGRLDAWLDTYLGVKPTAYTRTVGRAFMVSAVARAYRPGCKVDHALILEGDQGKGKSTACSILALDPEYFTDEIAELGTKDSAQNLPGKWLIELGELSAMRRGEVERVKGFMSRTFDRYRPSYGQFAADFPRRCVFIGSTNAGQYLVDDTGNRRWWPVACGVLDLDALRLDVEQLWAEAVVAFKAGEKWWPDAKEATAAAIEQETRRQADPWEETVVTAAWAIQRGEKLTVRDRLGCLETKPRCCDKVTANSVLEQMGVPDERTNKSQSTRIGFILKREGWTVDEERKAVSPAPRRWYVPPKVGNNW